MEFEEGKTIPSTFFLFNELLFVKDFREEWQVILSLLVLFTFIFNQWILSLYISQLTLCKLACHLELLIFIACLIYVIVEPLPNTFW